MRFTNAKSNYVLGKMLETSHGAIFYEHEGNPYIGFKESGEDCYFLTKNQLGNREILFDIICKGAPDVLKYATSGILTDYYTMEEFTEQNIRTSAYFDYNEIANKAPAQLEKHVLKLIDTDPTIVLERMAYITEREFDRNCDFILTNNRLLDASMRRMCEDAFMLDVVNNKTAKQNYKEVYSDFANENPATVRIAMDNLGKNTNKNVTKNDRHQMNKLISQTASFSKNRY